MDRIFFLIADYYDEAPKVERIDSNSPCARGEEIRAFMETAPQGAVLQIQENEYIVALGPLVRASWMRR
jgi:hypothetical protein